MQNYDKERRAVKRELFTLRHEKSIGTLKGIGSSVKTAGISFGGGVKTMAKGFQNQRKRGKGVGGWLQRIANAQ